MDRKTLQTSLVVGISVILLFAWNWAVPKLFPPEPAPEPVTWSTNAAPQANAILSATNAVPPNLTAATTNRPAVLLHSDAPEQLITVGTASAIYTFTSHGGGLKQVALKRYTETVGRQKKAATNTLVTLNEHAFTPIMAVRGDTTLTGDDVYKLTQVSPTLVRAEKTLGSGLSLVKEFQVGSNYAVNATVRLENHGKEALALPAQSWVVGTATPISPHDDERLMGVYWYDGVSKTHIDSAWFENKSMGCMGSNPRSEYAAGNKNVDWVAVHNQFFTVIVAAGTNQLAEQVRSLRLELAAPSQRQLEADPRMARQPHGFETSLTYPAVTLAPNQTLERRFMVYAGPKEYKTLSQFPDRLDLVMEFDGFFGFFAKLLLLSMNGLYNFVPDFKYLSGYATTIVLITVIIKAVFWPLTQASTRSMKRMQELQPQMKSIQERLKEDPAKMNRELMEFMKKNKVSPLGGCWPMLLQIPVFFGFFQMIRSAIELRGAQFLWAADLSQSDTVWIIPGLDWPLNPLPLMMGVTMLWQAQLTPPSPGMDPMQQKMMKYMPLMFMVFLYNFSAALTLYWTVQNLLTIAQMKLTKTRPGSAAGTAGRAPMVIIPPKKRR